MINRDAIIVGGGPCGLSAAIALQEAGLSPLVIEKGNIVNAIYHYPTHQTFFSSSEKLEIGEVPFITENRKPVRIQALTYYREVVKRKKIEVNAFELVESVEKQEDGSFVVTTSKQKYATNYVVIATGYYDNHNKLDVPGANLDKVSHYFKEGHPYFDKHVAVIGGKNSSVDAALELVNADAHVTVIYRGETYSPSVKPWILPEFEALVRNGTIRMEFESHVTKITEEEITFVNKSGKEETIYNDHVFAMIGYHPDHSFLTKMGVGIDSETGRPTFGKETMETNVNGIFIAGVIAAGNNANEIFIENGRFHGDMIAECIKGRR